MLEIYNSLRGAKQAFVPIREGEVRMYVCGMTVYDYIHVGHARMLTAFDVVQRYLRSSGYRVTYVRNITDIDDKIIARAASVGEPWQELAERFIAAMREDCARLGLQIPDQEPRATEHIPAILAMIDRLIEKGYAYVAADGDVLYSVRKFLPYGRLSGRNIEDLRAGARVQVDAGKQDPLDFVLWKHAKPGEPSWSSPWGPGRPGWHIECSAMSTQLLGPHFDLHGGGMDLMFPHHENEIAQTCAACDTPFVNVWMHNGFVNIDDEKMSKSLGNFFTVRDVLDRLRDPEVLRFFLLSSHYRGPINYSLAQLEQADETLMGLYRALSSAPADGRADPSRMNSFRDAMDDDFNTPVALAVAQNAARDLNIAKSRGDSAAAAAAGASLRAMGMVLGILQQNPAEILRKSTSRGGMSDADIESLLAARRAARTAKNFVESDRIRDQLNAIGVLIDDRPGGITEWRRA